MRTNSLPPQAESSLEPEPAVSPRTQAREFLLTGATGFVGKVVLSELLRRREELNLGTVHLLIRPRRGTSAEKRFQRRVLTSPCFSELPLG